MTWRGVSGDLAARLASTPHADAELQSIVSQMKADGLSQILSMQALVQLGGYSLADAKKIVHFSKAWEVQRPHNDDFHLAIAEEMSREEGSN